MKSHQIDSAEARHTVFAGISRIFSSIIKELAKSGYITCERSSHDGRQGNIAFSKERRGRDRDPRGEAIPDPPYVANWSQSGEFPCRTPGMG